MGIIDFMCRVFDDDVTMYTRCLLKSTIIVYDGKHLLLADNTTIYYFGALGVPPKDSYRFYTNVKQFMHGKKLYCKHANFLKYKNHCLVLDSTSTHYVCEWL